MTSTDVSGNTGPLAKRALLYLNDEKLRVPLSRVNAAAMQTLLGAVTRAGSLEEIEIILRYQHARDQRTWARELVEQILKDMRTSGEKESSDEGKAAAAAQQLGLIARIHRVVEERR